MSDNKTPKTPNTAPSVPWAMSPNHLSDIEKGLNAISADKMEKIHAEVSTEAHDDNYWPSPGSWSAYYKPYSVKDGVLSIPISGFLASEMDIYIKGFLTGFGYIEEALKRGLEDEEVDYIAFDINSGGGSVNQLFELCDRIYESRGKKPMGAYVKGACFSAAYAIASAVGPIYLSKTSFTGSIGIIATHFEEKDYLDKMGFKFTLITAGEGKGDGSPYEHLTPRAKKSIKSGVDAFYGHFTLDVARNRGISEAHVRTAQAFTYDANQSVEMGLADEVVDLNKKRAEFAKSSTTPDGDNEMADKKTNRDDKNATDDATPTEAENQVKLDAAVEKATEAGAAGVKERIAAVKESSEYTGREADAIDLLTDPEYDTMSAKGIIGILAKMPKPEEKAATKTNPFKEAMDADGGAKVPAADGGEDSEVSASQRILSAYTAAGGATKTTTAATQENKG